MNCEVCGVAVEGRTTRWCIACFKKLMRPCPECCDEVTGKVKGAFQKHSQRGKKETCTTCGRKHDGPVQRSCHCCGNNRYILEANCDPTPHQRPASGQAL